MLQRLLLFILLFTPSIVLASTCSNLANQINIDNAKYGNTVANKHLPWTNLSWLKKQLGWSESSRISPDQIEYKWICPEETDTYVAVITDNRGNITHVNGVFSNDDGAGTISICLSCFRKQQPVQPTVIKYEPEEPEQIPDYQPIQKQITAPVKIPAIKKQRVIKPLIKPFVKPIPQVTPTIKTRPAQAPQVIMPLTPPEVIPLTPPAVKTMPTTKPAVKIMPPAKPEVKTMPPAKPEVKIVPPAKPEVKTMPPAKPAVKTIPPAKPEVKIVPPAKPEVKIVPPAEPAVKTMPPAKPAVKTMPPAKPAVKTMPPATPAVKTMPPAEPEPASPPASSAPISPLKPLSQPGLPLETIKKPTLPLPTKKSKTTTIPAGITKPFETAKPVEKATATSTCKDVIKTIIDIAIKGSGANKPYEWESLSWLQKSFGTSQLQEKNNISGYEWRCDLDSLMYFIKDKQIIYGATQCSTEDDCKVFYASRINGIMKGFSVKIPGKN